jgi:putative dehydrogenase
MIGLGIMGSAMSAHLMAAGFGVLGYDPSVERASVFTDAGGQHLESARDVAQRVSLVITSLPSCSAAEQVCRELAKNALSELIVVETSTLPMDVKISCKEILAKVGAILLDCPLSGTGAQALTRDVVVYGSGDENSFESVRNVLEIFSRRVVYVGAFGQGSTMKYVANLLVAIHNVSTAEAFALGMRAGLDPQQLWDTIRDGAGGSVIFDKRGKLMIDEQYLPATAKVSMFVKDVSIVREYAQSLDLPTPLLDATVRLYDRAVAQGLADADAAALLCLMKTDHLDAAAEEKTHDHP